MLIKHMQPLNVLPLAKEEIHFLIEFEKGIMKLLKIDLLSLGVTISLKPIGHTIGEV